MALILQEPEEDNGEVFIVDIFPSGLLLEGKIPSRLYPGGHKIPLIILKIEYYQDICLPDLLSFDNTPSLGTIL